MKFNQEFIERVLEANNIVDIISQYTQLKPMSGGFMGRCPFPDHPEKTPSFSVSEAKQVYNCFGCHKKGNLITFLQQFNGMSFPEAIEYLAGRAHIAMPEPEAGENEKIDLISKKKKELMAANKLAAQFFADQFKRLPKDHPTKKYALEKRGLSDEIIQTFQIGYSPSEWDSLTKFLESKGISTAIAEEARLIKARKDGKTGHFDLFRDRLMFPIHNMMGEPIAFGGRIITQGEPKYLNSPETPVFTKGKVLYGLAQTAKYIRSEDQVLIVEGYMDLISLYQVGIRNVVATMGTALTPEHGKLLGRMTKNVVALFDGDSAGQEAAERSLPILLAADLHPKGLVLPDEMDPDDFIRAHGEQALRDLVSHSSDLLTMVLGMWMKDYRGDASQKVQLSDQLIPVFQAIQDPRLKQLYVEETAQRMGVDEKWLKNALAPKFAYNAPLAPKSPPKPAAHAPTTLTEQESKSPVTLNTEASQDSLSIEKITLKGISKPEELLIGLALKNRTNFEKCLETKVIDSVTAAGAKCVLEKAAAIYGQAPEKFDKLAGLLSSFVDRPEVLFPKDEDRAQEETVQDSIKEQEREAKLLGDCIRRIRDNDLKKKAEQLAQELKVNPSPEKMEQLMNIQRDRLTLSKE